MRPITLLTRHDVQLIRAGAAYSPEERAVLNAIIAEEEARQVAIIAVHDNTDTHVDDKVRALGQRVYERHKAVKVLMDSRRERD